MRRTRSIHSSRLHSNAISKKTLNRFLPRHRLRIASHSKTFTAAGVMLLREQGQVGLDDPIGRYVDGLHKDLARARIGELLSHSAGVTRDGPDAGQFLDRRPLSRAPSCWRTCAPSRRWRRVCSSSIPTTATACWG